MSWTTDYSQPPRARWRAAAYAAVRRPRRWLTVRRIVWLLCIAFSIFIIWEAGSHLGPGLRAAHGEGIPGLWTAQQDGSSGWTGEFVSSDGTVTLPNVMYTGSLTAAAPGTVVPALDAGAGDEVYPINGSDRWIHDVIGLVAGALALIALLARGFYVARRRRRAPPADYLTQAMAPGGYHPQPPASADYLTQTATPGGRVLRRRSRSRIPQTRAGRLAVLVLAVAVMGWACARFALLLADVRPYTGGSWFLALAAGIVLAVAPPWLLIRTTRAARAVRAAGPTYPARAPRPRVRRWTVWLLFIYLLALAGGLRYYLSLRYTPPPSGAIVAPPSALFVLELTGLAAETLIVAAITLLLAVTAEVIAPGPVGGWVRSRFGLRPIFPPPGQGLANTPDREP